MKKIISLLILFFFCQIARTGQVALSAGQPLVVVTPDQWPAIVDEPASTLFPFETYHVLPPNGRNAILLISIVGRDSSQYIDPQLLKTVTRASGRPYVDSADDLVKLVPKELKISGGLAYYLNFVDPDLVGKPVIKGKYKTATPITLSLGSKYLLSITILCDDLNGPDYQDMIKIVQSIKIKQ